MDHGSNQCLWGSSHVQLHIHLSSSCLILISVKFAFFAHFSKSFCLTSAQSCKNYLLSSLNFAWFSQLENSETKLRNDTKLSETKLSGDSISVKDALRFSQVRPGRFAPAWDFTRLKLLNSKAKLFVPYVFVNRHWKIFHHLKRNSATSVTIKIRYFSFFSNISNIFDFRKCCESGKFCVV